MPLVDLKSNLRKQTANVAYVNIKIDSTKTPSPIEISHNKTAQIKIVDDRDVGFKPIPGFPLATYYSQINTETQLGINKSTKFGPEQPFVVRNVGDNWDNISSNDSYNNVGTKLLDNDNLLFGSYTRLDKFLMSPAGDLFLNKQRDLMRGNAQKFRTDVKYGITGGENTLFGTAGFPDKSKATESPRKYDIQSLASNTPGRGKIDILDRDPQLNTLTGGTLAELISEELTRKATTVAATLERKLTGVGTEIVKQLGSKLLDKFDPGSDLRNKAKAIEKKVDAFNTVLGIPGGSVSKIKALALGDNKVFADSGKDLVNLIPYGSDKIKGRSYRDLDFIPFKFYDVNNDKSIVFRALLSGITDTFTPEYASERYIGRPDNVYVYTGTNREISFTFDIMPKSDEELLVLWEKMNALAGLTYPSWATAGGGGQGMIAPFCKLTLGQMYDNTSGYISGLTYTVMDNSTWETTFAKLPKYIQASVTFVYIGDRLPSSTQKHYEGPWISAEEYSSAVDTLFGTTGVLGNIGTFLKEGESEQAKQILDAAGF